MLASAAPPAVTPSSGRQWRSHSGVLSRAPGSSFMLFPKRRPPSDCRTWAGPSVTMSHALPQRLAGVPLCARVSALLRGPASRDLLSCLPLGGGDATPGRTTQASERDASRWQQRSKSEEGCVPLWSRWRKAARMSEAVFCPVVRHGVRQQ